MTIMLYQAYQAHDDVLAPLRLMAEATRGFLSHPWPFLGNHPLMRGAAAACEMVSRSALEDGIRRRATTNLDDIRRLLRLGMGPCQGGFCMYRATGVLHGLDGMTSQQANGALLDFLQERWKGIRPVLYGDQLRQARLDDWIFQGTLDVGHLST